MPIIVSNIRIGAAESVDNAIAQAKKILSVSDDKVQTAYVYKKSLDARRKGNVSYVVSVMVSLFEAEEATAKAVLSPYVSYKPLDTLEFKQGSKKLDHDVVIIGFGPAGIFAAHVLAKLGYKPVVFERGSEIDKRIGSVDRFFSEGILDCNDNIQFGEGGAGAFSDGKLTTRISDSRCKYVIEQLVKNGAPAEITTISKPHIGTDKLRGVIKSIRNEILESGGKIHFNKTVQDIIVKDGKVHAVVVDGEEIRTDNIILAVGHSARDMFNLIYEKNIAIESKGFSVGVRIEQLQQTIDDGLNLSGEFGKGEYQLSHRWNNSCVYTFCMCPGGFVVPSSSTEGSVVVNGMSKYARDGKNANSALVVAVDKQDFGDKPLDGMKFQEMLEAKAFKAGGGDYKAPAMTVGEYLNKKTDMKLGTVTPTYEIGVKAASFDHIFPQKINDMMRLGLQRFDTKLNGFAAKDGVLTGVETRTSSPVRILRNENLCSISVGGLYPCGEGAGYAGGIMSAAVDGIKVAQQIIANYGV